MNLLILDTATPACSAALLKGESVYERYELTANQHNRIVLRQCETLLAFVFLILCDEHESVNS